MRQNEKQRVRHQVKQHPKHHLDVLNITTVSVFFFFISGWDFPLIGSFPEELQSTLEIKCVVFQINLAFSLTTNVFSAFLPLSFQQT